MVNPRSIPASASAQDPIARDFTQISTENPPIRRLTVGYVHAGLWAAGHRSGRAGASTESRGTGEHCASLRRRIAETRARRARATLEAKPDRLTPRSGGRRRFGAVGLERGGWVSGGDAVVGEKPVNVTAVGGCESRQKPSQVIDRVDEQRLYQRMDARCTLPPRDAVKRNYLHRFCTGVFNRFFYLIFNYLHDDGAPGEITSGPAAPCPR